MVLKLNQNQILGIYNYLNRFIDLDDNTTRSVRFGESYIRALKKLTRSLTVHIQNCIAMKSAAEANNFLALFLRLNLVLIFFSLLNKRFIYGV